MPKLTEIHGGHGREGCPRDILDNRTEKSYYRFDEKARALTKHEVSSRNRQVYRKSMQNGEKVERKVFHV